MMNRDDSVVRIIHEFNLSYLLLAKHLVSLDKAAASFRLGLCEATLDKISALSLPQLLKLAEMNQLICKFRFNNDADIDHVTKESRIEGLQSVHAGILLSTSLLAELQLN